MLNKTECKVSMFNVEDTIQNHLQNSTQYSFGTRYLKIGTVNLPIEYQKDFENMLWYKYFINHKEDAENNKEFAKQIYDWYNSKRSSFFSSLVKQQGEIPTVLGDIFDCEQNVIGHQTNCQGVMGSGIAKIVKAKFPSCFEEYKLFCDKFSNKEDLLGECQICQVGENKYIANLFGQCKFGTDKCYSDYNALKKALINLKIKCAGKGLSISLPYNISCGRAGGNWETVYGIIKDVFIDYPVILYKI